MEISKKTKRIGIACAVVGGALVVVYVARKIYVKARDSSVLASAAALAKTNPDAAVSATGGLSLEA